MQCAEQIIKRKQKVCVYTCWFRVNEEPLINANFVANVKSDPELYSVKPFIGGKNAVLLNFAKMVIFINQRNEIALPKDAKDKTPDDSHKIYVIYKLICIFLIFCAQYVAPAQIIFIQMVLFNIF